MGLIFRPTCRAAALLTTEEARRLARTTKDKQTKHSVYKGFILRAIGTGGNVIVQVIDKQSVMVYGQWNSYGPQPWPFLTGQYVDNRDIALLAPVGKPTPPYELVTATSETFVGFASHAFFTTASSFSGFFHAAMVPSSSGGWVAVPSVAVSLSSPTTPGAEYQVAISIVAGGGRTAKIDQAITFKPSIYTQQVYTWDDAFLATLTGEADIHIGVRSGGGWSWAPYIDGQMAIRPEAFPNPIAGHTAPRLFCMAHTVFSHPPFDADPELNGEKALEAGIFMAGVLPWPALLPPNEYLIEFNFWRLSMLRDLGIPELVPQISTSRTFTVPPDPLRMLRNLVTCVGTVIGDANTQRVLFACTVDQDETEETGVDGEGDPTYTTWTKTAHYVLRIAVTSGTITVVHATDFCENSDDATHFSLPLKPDIPTVHVFSQCSVDVLVGIDRVLISYLAFNRLLIKTVGGDWPRIEPTDIDFVLLRDDGIEVVTGLLAAGYTAIMPKYTGEFSVAGNPHNFGYTSDADGVIAFDIGENRIGVLATSDQTSTVAQAIKLVVIDAITGAFVEVRGTVGTYTPDTSLNAAGSCVQRDTATKPGVFLANINRYATNEKDQYVSNDGGWTWEKYRDNVAGTPYYLGNQLHRAVISHTI